MAHAEQGQTGSAPARFSAYLSESVEELKKVSTPTRQETTQATIVTIVMLLFVAFVLFVLDLFFGWIMRAVI